MARFLLVGERCISSRECEIENWVSAFLYEYGEDRLRLWVIFLIHHNISLVYPTLKRNVVLPTALNGTFGFAFRAPFFVVFVFRF